jgi:hypothetical protein
MSNISLSSPILKSFVQADSTIGTAITTVLAANATSSRRVIVTVQNKSATASIEIILNTSGTQGILVPPLSNISLDNYNGPVRAFATAASTLIHVAYSEV